MLPLRPDCLCPPAGPTPTATQRPPQDDKKGESGFESGAFEALESDFQEVRKCPICVPCAVADATVTALLEPSASSPAPSLPLDTRAANVMRSTPPPPHPLQVLQELVGDKSLERFRSEYDKLHRALKKSHESEKRLIKKCRELNQARTGPPETSPHTRYTHTHAHSHAHKRNSACG